MIVRCSFPGQVRVLCVFMTTVFALIDLRACLAIRVSPDQSRRAACVLSPKYFTDHESRGIRNSSWHYYFFILQETWFAIVLVKYRTSRLVKPKSKSLILFYACSYLARSSCNMHMLISVSRYCAGPPPPKDNRSLRDLLAIIIAPPRSWGTSLGGSVLFFRHVIPMNGIDNLK